MSDIAQLLRAYVDDASEDAFQEIVARFLDLVYFTALRRTGGDAPLAEDVAQIVFTDFARKARSLRADSALGGWLHRHTCFVSSTIMRRERARVEREQHALEMNALQSAGEPAWKEIAPALDEAIDQLDEADRHAVLLRFFERRDFRSVGAAIGASEDTAQKRVSRALEKLRVLLARRGVVLSVASLSGLLAAESVSASPAGLSAKIGRVAWSAAAISTGSPSAITNLINLMKTKKLALAIGFAGVAAFLAWPLLSGELHSSNSSLAAAPPPVALEASASPPAPAAKATPAAPSSANVSSTTLHLNFVALDSGRPIPNVPLDCWGLGSVTSHTHFTGNRDGTLDVVVPNNSESIKLTTGVEGFADTRLHWDTTRGEQIPSTYTVRLDRPAPIGGTVVDAQGNPVADAKVGFNAFDDPSAASAPEDHEFGWIEVKTVPDGRWSINRIATNMIHRIYGGARHPDHLEARVFLSNDHDAEALLLKSAHIFKLGVAATVSGVVLDTDGKPAPGATVRVGGVGNTASRETRSLADGTFELRGCKPGREPLSAELAGFAPTTMDIEVKSASDPVTIQIKRGKTLQLRVVGKGGEPIPHATVVLNTLPLPGPDGRVPQAIQAEFQGKTGPDGRIRWTNAPDTNLPFDILARGFMRDEATVRPDGQEHTIQLQTALTVTGSVRDAATGKLIPKFRFGTGWPDTGTNGTIQPSWSTIGRFWPSFSGGEFKHTYEEAVVMGGPNPGYILKFEAEGYQPFVTRLIAADEGEVKLDVSLQPAL